MTINQINVPGVTPANAPDKYEQLFVLYEKYINDPNTIPKGQKNANGLWRYINKEDSGFVFDGIVNTYDKLANKNNLEDVKNTLKIEQDKVDQKKGKEIEAETEKSRKIEGEKADRLTGLLKLQDALEDFKKDPKYANNQSQSAFIGYLNERKAKANDTSLTYYGFETNEIIFSKDGVMEKPTVESIKNEEKINPATEQKVNAAEEKPETQEEKTLTVAKTKLRESIGKYIDKIKALKNSKEDEKNTLKEEIKKLKEDLKKQKKDYEDAKTYFLGTTNYKTEELSKISTRRIRFGKKTVQGGVVTRTLTERLQFSTIRRRMTVNTLVKKFNNIGDKPTDGVRFIMGFEHPRFLRYTGIHTVTGLDKLGGKMGLKINPSKFHEQFNRGRDNILAVMDKGEKTPEEQKVIDALKKRINYYGYAYARQRASAWTNPFLEAEKNAGKEAKIIQMNTKPEQLNVAA